MKIILIIWTLLFINIYSQNNCNNFITRLSFIDNNYSELNPSRYRNHISFNIKQKDSVVVKMLEKNEVIFTKNYGILDSGMYRIKFYNSDLECPSYRMFFAKLFIGEKSSSHFLEIASVQDDLEKDFVVDSNLVISSIDGIWRRNYNSVYFPSVQPDVLGAKKYYNYEYCIEIKFSKNSYEIMSERTQKNAKNKNTEKFKGEYTIKGDSLLLFENAKFIKLFKFNIENDTLTISNFVKRDKNSGMMIAPINRNMNSTKPELLGKYSK